MFRLTVITGLLLCFAFSPAHAQDKEIAFQYYTQASRLYEQGSYDASRELLLNAVEFYPDFSDALYLLARIYEQKQESTSLSLECYTKALKASSWISVPASSAQKRLAGLYVRIRKYAAALDTLAAIKDSFSADAQLELIRARALRGLKRVKTASAVFRNALRVYPGYLDLYTAYIDFLIEIGSLAEARSVMEKGVGEFKNQPAVAYYQAALERNPALKMRLIDAYIELNGTRPEIALQALALKTDNPQKYIDFFIAAGGPGRADLLNEFNTLLSSKQDLLGYAEERIGEADGVKIIDADRDGYYEEQYTYTRGLLVQWTVDNNQDGRFELQMDLVNQNPTSVTIYDQAGRKIEYRYNIYPYLKQACFTGGGSSVCYDLVPAAVALIPVNLPKDRNKTVMRLTTRTPIRFPDEKTVRAASFAAAELSPTSGKPFRRWEFENGQKTKLIEDTDGNLQMDHIVIYNKGIRVSGMQDLDGDGVFEIMEKYTQGKLTALTFDDDGDGNPDYVQSYISGERKMWDLNSDGTYDVIEYIDAKGRTVRQYSTKLNGVFNLTIIVQ
jgi:tetratricopeptide (TPR) repeat protein